MKGSNNFNHFKANIDMYSRLSDCAKSDSFKNGIVNGAEWYTADGSMQGNKKCISTNLVLNSECFKLKIGTMFTQIRLM